MIKTNIFTLVIRLQKTFSRRLVQDQYIPLGHTSSRRLQDILPRRLQTFPRRLQDFLQEHLQGICKTFSRRSEDVFKTSSKRLQDVLQNCLQDIFKKFSGHFQEVFQWCFQEVFKTYHLAKLFLLICIRDVFNTFLRRTAKTVIYRRICLGETSKKLMVSVQNLQEW